MGAHERFRAQIAHLSEPDVLAKFEQDKGDADMGITPESYLVDYGGAPGGSRPDLYERVCHDIGVVPRFDAMYVTPERLRNTAESVLRAYRADGDVPLGDTIDLAELVLEAM